jgi:hypothetical protein
MLCMPVTTAHLSLNLVNCRKNITSLLHEFLGLQIDDHCRFFKVIIYIKSGRLQFTDANYYVSNMLLIAVLHQF